MCSARAPTSGDKNRGVPPQKSTLTDRNLYDSTRERLLHQTVPFPISIAVEPRLAVFTSLRHGETAAIRAHKQHLDTLGSTPPSLDRQGSSRSTPGYPTYLAANGQLRLQ
ncbi:Hypothetical predicted protein, partial [Pelobates cultripes]